MECVHERPATAADWRAAWLTARSALIGRLATIEHADLLVLLRCQAAGKTLAESGAVWAEVAEACERVEHAFRRWRRERRWREEGDDMHSRPMRDDEGTFDEWRPARAVLPGGAEGPWPCSRCGGTRVRYRTWESRDGAYEDVQYECPDCPRTWWVEGDDG